MPATVLIYFFVVMLSKKAGVLKEAVLPSGIAALVERLVHLQGKFVLRRDICGAPVGSGFTKNVLCLPCGKDRDFCTPVR